MGAACSLAACKTERSALSVTAGNDPLSVIKDTPDGIKPEYKLGDLLGKGSFGNVYKAVHKKTQKEYAVKIMDRSKIKPTSIHREWNVLEHLGHHPYIVDYIATYKTRDHIYFCMECMYGGELFDRLIRRGAYAEVEVRAPFRNLANALAYLHSQGIVHRDLKPENILLSDTSEFPSMKIADFGLSQLIAPNERLLKVCGTWAYAAPEMSDPSRPGYDCRFDVFSFGVILYVVLSGTHPFDPTGDLPVNDIKARARAVQFDFNQPEWSLVSDSAKDLIRRLIVKDPERRLTSRDMLQHEWFREDTGVALLRPPVAGDDRGEGVLIQPPASRLQQISQAAAAEDAARPRADGGGSGHARSLRSGGQHRAPAAELPSAPDYSDPQRDLTDDHARAPAQSGAARGGHGRRGLQQFAAAPTEASPVPSSRVMDGGRGGGAASAVVAPAPHGVSSGSPGVQISVARSVANNAGLQPGMQMTVVAGHDGTLQLVPTSSLLPVGSLGPGLQEAAVVGGHQSNPLSQYRDGSSLPSPLFSGRQSAPGSHGSPGAAAFYAHQQHLSVNDDTVVVPNVLRASADGSSPQYSQRALQLAHQRRGVSHQLTAAVDAHVDPGTQLDETDHFGPSDGDELSSDVLHRAPNVLTLGPDEVARAALGDRRTSKKDDGSVGTSATRPPHARGGRPVRSPAAPLVTGPFVVPENSGGEFPAHITRTQLLAWASDDGPGCDEKSSRTLGVDTDQMQKCALNSARSGTRYSAAVDASRQHEGWLTGWDAVSRTDEDNGAAARFDRHELEGWQNSLDGRECDGASQLPLPDFGADDSSTFVPKWTPEAAAFQKLLQQQHLAAKSAKQKYACSPSDNLTISIEPSGLSVHAPGQLHQQFVEYDGRSVPMHQFAAGFDNTGSAHAASLKLRAGFNGQLTDVELQGNDALTATFGIVPVEHRQLPHLFNIPTPAIRTYHNDSELT